VAERWAALVTAKSADVAAQRASVVEAIRRLADSGSS